MSASEIVQTICVVIIIGVAHHLQSRADGLLSAQEASSLGHPMHEKDIRRAEQQAARAKIEFPLK